MARTSIPHDALVMVGDGARAIFFRNTGSVVNPSLAVENVFEQDNPPTREQGTDQPTSGAAFASSRAPNAASPRGNIEQTDWHQLNEDRFAKDIADRLYQLAHANRFQSLVLVAPPKVLGVLRKSLHKEVLGRVTAEVPKEFTKAPITTIQRELTAGSED
jgi:protein required for attachment to host cells